MNNKKQGYIIQNVDSKDIVGTEYAPGHGQAKVILDEQGIPIGYIWCEAKDNTLLIDMLEVIEKERGIGTKLVPFLFEHFGVHEISGDVLMESSLRAYYFWESLGAEFTYLGECDDPSDAFAEHIDIAFVVKKAILSAA